MGSEGAVEPYSISSFNLDGENCVSGEVPGDVAGVEGGGGGLAGEEKGPDITECGPEPL